MASAPWNKTKPIAFARIHRSNHYNMVKEVDTNGYYGKQAKMVLRAYKVGSRNYVEVIKKLVCEE
jgi:hypothetical protein